MINYYFHCKRQCWLFSKNLQYEDNSEDVRIGRVLHEERARKNKKSEIMIDNIKIDKIIGDTLVEYKKSDADLEAAKWQLLFYLKVLKDKGIYKDGRLEVDEKKKQDKKRITLLLTPEIEQELTSIISDMQEMLVNEKMPETINQPKCKKCAYYEFCYL